jgi:hypothetical protein
MRNNISQDFYPDARINYVNEKLREMAEDVLKEKK